MKTYPRDKTGGTHRLAASFLVSTLGVLSIAVHAEPAQLPTAAPQLAMTKTADQAENLQTPKVQPIETAPSLHRTELAGRMAAPGATAADTTLTEPASATKMAQAGGGIEGADDLLWLLDSETRPWPLAYTDLSPLNALYIALPTEREARIMLPGYVSDIVDRARFIASRYVTDNIGSAAQIRGRQLEALNLWVANINKQKRLLSKDPWMAYQFSKEARATLAAFKEKVEAQSAPTVQHVAEDVKATVEKITPLMAVMATYEQQMQWYNLLVQLKEGVSLYQTRIADADNRILTAIADFERDNPIVPRPAGAPPVNPETHREPAITPAPTASVAMTPAVQRELAQPPAKKEESSSQMGGAIVLLAMGAAVVGFFMKLRRRVSKKGTVAKDDGN